jgi:soluble lytic murein transglycosylase-like protein
MRDGAPGISDADGMSFQRDLPPNAAGPARGHVAWLRAMLCLAGAALLSACAATTPHAPQMTATQEAATYIARAKPTYAPPGPPTDPWGPYITEASRRFDVPEAWVRQVIRVESGGYEYRANGTLVTSPVGAMGLMQLMPETYDEMRARYALGDDAFNPHDNILAGTAYLREMYDNFGSPGFLAAPRACKIIWCITGHCRRKRVATWR